MEKTFSGYSYGKYEITDPAKYPKDKHYVALVFGTASEYEAPYNPREEGRYVTVSRVTVYAFTEKSVLEKFVSEIILTSTKFVFFEVPKVGKATVKVEVDSEV